MELAGPFEVFSLLPGTTCRLTSIDGGVVQADGGVSLTDVKRLRDIESCGVLCVPGGFGVTAAMRNPAYISQLQRLSANARYVTSVGNGSLLLAAAGVLDGRRAACHWAWRQRLARFGATADASRVVRDGNVITGRGAIDGVDVALAVLAEIAGPGYAHAVHITLEYAPTPSFGAPMQNLTPQEIDDAMKH
jgi:transcriptional regulator GlxA family with amidase domain